MRSSRPPKILRRLGLDSGRRWKFSVFHNNNGAQPVSAFSRFVYRDVAVPHHGNGDHDPCPLDIT